MPKELVTARLSEEVIAILTKYQELHNCKITEALEIIISLYPIFLRDAERHRTAEISIDSETKENPCQQRIKFLNNFYCAHQPTRGKMIKLLTLNQCQACKVRQFGLPTKRLQGISETSLITDETRKKYPHYEPPPRKKYEPETKEWRSNEQ